MFSKVAIILPLIALAIAAPQHAPGAQFPPGVNPSLCPNFPICDNAVLHNTAPAGPQQWNAPAPQWNPQPAPQWNPQPAPQWNPQPAPQWNHQPAPQWNPQPAPHYAPALTGPTSNHLPGTSGGDKYPAGVNPHSCPNYPYCDTNAGLAGHAPQVAPLPGYTERLYPAGVSPQQCPNFPYCS